MMKLLLFSTTVLVTVLYCVGSCVKKPDHTQYAEASRWLIAESTWGVLATSGDAANADLQDKDKVKQAIPFSNVVSFSDGFYHSCSKWNSTGIPRLYLTHLDSTLRDLKHNSWASLTVSQLMVDTCQHDAEDPTCWKVTLTGQVRMLQDPNELSLARTFLFSKHPEMKDWPSDHSFQLLELVPRKIFLLDWYGGAHPIDIAEYLNVQLDNSRSFLELD